MIALNLKGRFARGLWAQGLSMTFEVGHRFALVPLYLAAWPVDMYGEWLVIQAAVMFLPLADLGIMPYFSNAAAMAWARQDTAAFDRLLRVAFGLYALLLVLVVPLYAVAVLLIADAGGLDDGTAIGPDGRHVWLALGLYHLVRIPQGVLQAIYRARTSYALETHAALLKELAVLVAVAVALALQASPAQLAWIHLAMGVLVYGPMVADQKRRYPDLRYGLALPSRAEFRSFVGNLGWFTVLPVADRLIANGPVLVLGLVASEAAVVVFSTLRILSGVIRAGAERISYLTGAEMAALYARGDAARLLRLYLFAGRLAIGLAAFAAGLLWVVGEPFLELWTGGKVAFDRATLAALLGALVFASHGHIPYMLLHYTNRPRQAFPLLITRAVLSLVLGAALAPRYGSAGMAVGLMLTEVALMSVLLPLRLHRVDGLPFWSFVTRNLVVVGPAFGLSAAAAHGLVWLIGTGSLLHLAVVGGLWGTLMAAPGIFLLLDRDQRGWLLAGLRRVLRYGVRPASP